MENVGKRSEEILSSLISEFINSGEPVGSQTVAKHLDRKFSPATIRNVMSDLEKKGLLAHLHTSGGRVPTDRGMRYYVDRLLKYEPLPEPKISDIKNEYKGTSYNISDIMKKTSSILSQLSNYAGLVVAPQPNDITIKHMEFISLSKNKVLGIFVGREGTVENRIIKIEEELKFSDLEKITNYCNRAFYGLTLSEAKDKIFREMTEAQIEYDRLINSALHILKNMICDMEKSELFVDGGTQLLTRRDFTDLEKATSLLNVLEKKKQLTQLLNSAVNSERVNIFIGSESGYGAISECALIATPYKKDGKFLGALGIIGPVRMDYSKVIPIVDCTAKLMSDFLDGEGMYDI